ncbi:unnamed protein product [Acanthoscelides obtectus]|uniref:Tc1-like transposase DDE domain-containing protein n=1 Tax=Acanthoscelides obtectus TaxID=200917 RepID=A0A9P0PQH9_ACAOB|nr:unnamed protein product [Acanthoscelides obtectus]CAK1621484.1 Histone-lysine N-methyltransferase SETMAR [Acanthoscelides obtectus]
MKDENVEAMRKLIIKDRHATYREIEASLKISKTSIQKIVHEELGVRTLEQKAARVNWCQKRLTPTKVIRSRSVSKKMVAIFVSKAGHIATITLNEQRTVTADWYTTICLPKVISELRKINSERRLILHQDNASSHTAQKTRQYLTEENVELLDHPPYSPDLRHNDFFTFPKIKNRLRGQRFQSPEEVVDAFKNAVLDLPADEWHKCFENWFERMQIWAKEHRQWTPQQLCAIQWSDEARFEVCIEESLLPVMAECLTSGQDFVFQQDGAACHTSKKAIKWMEENNVPLLKWVSSSLDLSPFETLWHEMKKT